MESRWVVNGWIGETTYLCDAKSDHFRPVLLWELVGAVGAGVRLVVVLAVVGGGCRAGRRNHSVKRGGSQSQGGDKTTPQANVPNRNPAFELRAKRLETDIRMALSRETNDNSQVKAPRGAAKRLVASVSVPNAWCEDVRPRPEC